MLSFLISLFSFLFSFLWPLPPPPPQPQPLRIQESVALALPEIRAHIALFLNRNDLAKCALVCKHWSYSFAPPLYTDCSIVGAIHPSLQKMNPSIETLNKYADTIRKLRYVGSIEIDYLSINCTKLKVLAIEIERLSAQPGLSPAIAELIQRNTHTLKTFLFRKQMSITSTTDIWEELANCQTINLIQVSSCNIHSGDMTSFWKACSKAKVLYLQAVKLYCGSSQPQADLLQFQFPRLRYLYISSMINVTNYSQLSIVAGAPKLEIFNWKPCHRSGFPIDEYQETFSQHCTRVRDLTIHHPLSDRDLALILDSMEKANRLVFMGGKFSTSALSSLMSRHSRTIRKLKLGSCDTVRSAMVQTILSGCPLLEIFEAKAIQGADLVCIQTSESDISNNGVTTRVEVAIGNDWVCLGLKSLSLQFDLSGRTPNIRRDHGELFLLQLQLEQKYAFRQLARLTRLETLDISAQDHSNQGVNLDLRLKPRGRGLQQLSTLSSLENFKFERTIQRLSEKEITWMVEHWPRINILLGKLHVDSVHNLKLKVHFKDLLKRRKQKTPPLTSQ